MIHEVAEIEIIEHKEGDFENAVALASKYFKAAKGYISLSLTRSVENPSRYRLIVGWETLEDHIPTFRESSGFQEWRKLAGRYFASPPTVEHVTTVFTAD